MLIELTNDLSSEKFYHGTKSNFNQGDLIVSGFSSNYGRRKKAKYLYLTATFDAEIWGDELYIGDSVGRIYIIKPTGLFEGDLNMTIKKFQGNTTRSYRSMHPIRVIGEITDWHGHSMEVLKTMKNNIERVKHPGIGVIEV